MKSLKAGTLAEGDIINLPSRMKTEHLVDIFDPEFRLEERGEWEEYDMLYSEGATTIDGNAFSGDEEKGFVLLFVDGDLLVQGSLIVEDDPPSFLVVTGNLRVEGNLLLAGFVEVQGTTNVGGVMMGDYNHGFARFYGDVAAGAFVDNSDYPLEIDGARAFAKTIADPPDELADKIRGGASAAEILTLL